MSLEKYIPEVFGPSDPFTHRKLSEIAGQKIDLSSARLATTEMRKRINGVFNGFNSSDFDEIDWGNPASSYQVAVSSIPDHLITDRRIPPIDKNKSVYDYLHVDIEKYSEFIESDVRISHKPGSIPVTFLDLMKQFTTNLGIKDQEAATMTMRVVTSKFPIICQIGSRLSNFFPDIVASRLAFNSLELEVPDQLAKMLKMDLPPLKAQSLLLEQTTYDGSLPISNADKEGIIKVSHIQDRPYGKNELESANLLINKDLKLANSIIIFQQLLIKHAYKHFQSNPERFNQRFETYNTVLVPKYNSNGTVDFLPNPKFLSTISNNIVPAIAREMDSGGDQLTPEMIEQGIDSAKKYNLFNDYIGEFVSTDDPNRTLWKGAFAQVCPARDMIIKAMHSVLPLIYSH